MLLKCQYFYIQKKNIILFIDAFRLGRVVLGISDRDIFWHQSNILAAINMYLSLFNIYLTNHRYIYIYIY